MFFKNEKDKCFAYLAHTACDNNNFILDFHITPGNIHDSVAFSDLYKKLRSNSKQHTTVIDYDLLSDILSHPIHPGQSSVSVGLM